MPRVHLNMLKTLALAVLLSARLVPVHGNVHVRPFVHKRMLKQGKFQDLSSTDGVAAASACMSPNLWHTPLTAEPALTVLQPAVYTSSTCITCESENMKYWGRGGEVCACYTPRGVIPTTTPSRRCTVFSMCLQRPRDARGPASQALPPPPKAAYWTHKCKGLPTIWVKLWSNNVVYSPAAAHTTAATPIWPCGEDNPTGRL